MTAQASSTLEIARGYLAAGLGVLPIRPDGSKSPPLPKGHPFLKERPTDADLVQWFADGRNGIAIPGGKVSGNLETLDFETATVYLAWRELVNAQIPGLVERLCWCKTPGHLGERGLHARYRCPGVGPLKTENLAHEPELDEWGVQVLDAKTGRPKARLLIETRSEGGYAVAPGSPPECHSTRRLWEHVAGPDLRHVPDVTMLEREVMLSSARALNSWIDESDIVAAKPAPARQGGGLSPGDDYSRRGPDWSEVLGDGWLCVRTSGDVRYWRRPGKSNCWSATTGFCKAEGIDLLHVFSGNAQPFKQGGSYSKFRALALLHHRGDFKETARILGEQNYGEQRAARPAPAQKPHEANGHASNGHAKPPAEPKKPEEEVWDLPVPLEESGVKVEEFPLDVFPGHLPNFFREAASALNCPIDYPACFGIGVAAGSIGALYAVEVKEGYPEPISLYLCVVAPKGSGKTPALKAIAAPLYAEAARRHHAEDRTPAYVSDITVEKYAELMHNNPRGNTPVIRDEASGWMRSMDQYKSKGSGSDRQFWLSANSAEPLSVHRKDPDSPAVWVQHPCVTFVGGIQPPVLARLKGDDDGFYDRLLFSYPEPLPACGETWATVPRMGAEAWDRIILQILRAPMTQGPHGPRPYFLKLNSAACKVWEDWTNFVAGKRNDPEFPEYLKGPAIKLTGFAARLAGVVHALREAWDGATPEIDGDDMRGGAALAAYFLSHTAKVYRAMGRDPRTADAKRVLEWLTRWKEKTFSRRDAWRSLRKSFDSPEALTAPLKLLAAHGYICWVDPASAGYASNHTSAYVINPNLPQVTGDTGDRGDGVDTK